MSVETAGLDEASTAIGDWAANLDDSLQAASEGFGASLVDEVASEVPVLTGRLQDSVQYDLSPDGIGVDVSIGEDVPYAGWIEFGGSRGREYIAEGRYLYPTATEAQSDWVDIATQTATDSVGSYSWPTPAS